MFVDASALCAVLLGEPDGEEIAAKIKATKKAITSPVAIFEAALAVARVVNGDLAAARREVDSFVRLADIALVPIGEAELERALDAFDRFGEGQHPARLNMGDCFAYACARTHGAGLLFKGDDFAKTDVAFA